MIAWSIETAKASRLFDQVIVSTDDKEIAAVSKHAGAHVPFIRPPELSDDFTGTVPVIAHAVEWALREGMKLEAVCCIYATAPFTRSSDIERGLCAIESGKWQYAFAATDFPAPIFRAFTQNAAGGVQMFLPEHFPSRSQDLPIALHDAGQFYWGLPKAWLDGKGMFEPHSTPIMIPRWRVQDIDSEEDWTRAELIAPTVFGHLR
jgi:N-acylneuraminate cytidylyltransferase